MSLARTEAMTAEQTWSHAAEMQSARRVQSRLLPEGVPGPESLECAGLSLPLRGVGGDFYDFFDIGAGRISLVLGDVSGKGVPAALMMATLRASLRCHYAFGTGDLSARLESVNRLFGECIAVEHYASLFVGEFDEPSGRLRYANCGHVPPVVLRRDLRVERLAPTATVLGMFDDWTCEAAETTLAEGDVLVLVSDGVTEATGASGEAFGDARLPAALVAHRDLRAGALLRAIADEARAFCGNAPMDDLTLLAARVRRRGELRPRPVPKGNGRGETP